MQKMVRRLEIEKEELQTALDEAEGSLQAEESKVARAQMEVPLPMCKSDELT